MEQQRPIIAAFDFDHTLIDRDSLLPFLIYVKGYLKTFYHLTALSSTLIGFVLNKVTRQEVKEKILIRFFQGWAMPDLQALGNSYAETVLDDFVKPKAIQRLRWHQSQGHRCILVSASPEFYLKPWAARHGFETVLASRLEEEPAGQVTGHLQGLNCWGLEKQHRLVAYLGPKDSYELYAYGDSRGDRELLALADHPFYRCFS